MNCIKKRSFLLKFAVISLAIAGGVYCVIVRFGGSDHVYASASGPSPSHTNAPGEDNCTACHVSFDVNSGAGSVSISGIPANYLPNQQVSLTVTTADSGPSATEFGFQMTAIDRQGRSAGSFTLPAQNPARSQVVTGFVGGHQRNYVEHTIDGLFLPNVFGHNTWTFTWTAPPARVGKIDFYASGNAANGDGTNSGDYIYTTSAASLSGTAIANFDGDTKSEISVFRPSNGVWYSLSSLNAGFVATQFGSSGDRIVPGDYDGDGKTDYAVYRPSEGLWYLLNSTSGFTGIRFGAADDIPVPADYDGDGKTDIAVYRPSDGVWYLLQSSAGFAATQFGISEDRPVPGDYDADGKADIAVFRPSTGIWYLLQSSAGFAGAQFGAAEDKPVQGDYDGDGKTDIAVFRPSSGTWYLLRSTAGFTGMQFGFSTDLLTPADYDGDGKTDIAVFRPSEGVWYGLRSSDSSLLTAVFGTSGDVPVPAAYIPQTSAP